MANDHVKMFTEEYAPVAEQVSKQIGVAPSVLLAQWGMETDYGRKMPGHFNFGNIKDISGSGTSAVDNQTKSKDKYVNFESPEAFGDYYAHMMRRLYPEALNTGSDISKYAQGLRSGVKGAYAEDKNYEDAIRGAYKTTSNFYTDVGGDEQEKGSASPFEGYESEASKLKKEPAEKKPEPTDTGEDARITGAVVGAGANLLGPALTDPKITPKIDTSKAIEAQTTAADKLELARRNLERAAPQGTEDIEAAYRGSQQELQNLRNEERLAQSRLRALPRAVPPVEMPAAPVVEAPSRTVAGDPGAVNWIRSMSEGVPDVVANQALNMRADNPRGGQAIIDADMAARQRQAALGLGDYGLARTAGGVQLALPPTTVAERQADEARQAQQAEAELETRTQQAQARQSMQEQQLEQQRLAHEADLQRVRDARAQLGTTHGALAEQRRALAPMQRALTSAETQDELARRKLERARQQPNTGSRAAEIAGVKSAKVSPFVRPVVGGLTGYVGVMSYQDALERFKAGDTSEGVLKALEAGAAGASMVPPVGKGLTRLRGAGVLSGLGLGGYELGRRLLKDRPPEQ